MRMNLPRSIWFLIFVFVSVALVPFAASAEIMFGGKPVVDIVLEIVKLLLRIAGGIAMFMLVMSGIYYMISTGSMDSIQSAKKMLTAAIAGLIIIILSYSLLELVQRILT